MIKTENGQVEVSGRKKEIEGDLIGIIRTINISCTEKGQSKEKIRQYVMDAVEVGLESTSQEIHMHVGSEDFFQMMMEKMLKDLEKDKE